MNQPEPPRGPFCQSCGMPMESPDQFGIDAGGLRVNDYCSFCFEDGRFTQPEITREQMIAKVAGLLTTLRGMPEERARQIARELIPRLKRWSRTPAEAPR